MTDAALVSPAVVEVLSGLDTVERVVGVDSPFDVVNSVIGDGGQRVPAWRVTGDLRQVVTLTAGRWPLPGEALVAADAQQRLGLTAPAGAVTDTSSGAEHHVVGAFAPRAPFDTFDAGLVVAGDGSAHARSVQVVVASVGAARITEALTTISWASPWTPTRQHRQTLLHGRSFMSVVISS